jgi:hypothetical protein
MQPLFPILQAKTLEPNVELLRRTGWAIGFSEGNYCVAWKDQNEVVFEWRSGDWHRVSSRSG